jgi:PleD family two-component response regulator
VIAVVKEADHARIVFERLRASIEAIKLVIDGHDVPVRVSIGYTTTLGESLASMIDLADRAVFGAKDAGRNCVVRL